MCICSIGKVSPSQSCNVPTDHLKAGISKDHLNSESRYKTNPTASSEDRYPIGSSTNFARCPGVRKYLDLSTLCPVEHIHGPRPAVGSLKAWLLAYPRVSQTAEWLSKMRRPIKNGAAHVETGIMVNPVAQRTYVLAWLQGISRTHCRERDE